MKRAIAVLMAAFFLVVGVSAKEWKGSRVFQIGDIEYSAGFGDTFGSGEETYVIQCRNDLSVKEAYDLFWGNLAKQVLNSENSGKDYGYVIAFDIGPLDSTSVNVEVAKRLFEDAIIKIYGKVLPDTAYIIYDLTYGIHDSNTFQSTEYIYCNSHLTQLVYKTRRSK